MGVDVSSYIGGLISAAIAITAIWGFIKVVKEIKKENDSEHDRRQRWDKMADVVEKNEKDWNEGLKDIYAERGKIVERYDTRLDQQDQRMNDQDAKIQQLLSMMCMCLRAQDTILEALVEKGIGNGEIKAMHSELKTFIMDQVQN